jgi:hypothetical protein
VLVRGVWKVRRSITIVRGNDKDIIVKVTQRGVPIDLTDIQIFCEVKDEPGGNLLFTATVSKTNPTSGEFQVRFPKAATASLLPNRKVYFDFLFVFPDGSEKNFPVPPVSCDVVERVTD